MVDKCPNGYKELTDESQPWGRCVWKLQAVKVDMAKLLYMYLKRSSNSFGIPKFYFRTVINRV
jgi:hypothetical protein